jgi:hypothetical protein
MPREGGVAIEPSRWGAIVMGDMRGDMRFEGLFTLIIAGLLNFGRCALSLTEYARWVGPQYPSSITRLAVGGD